MRCWTLLVVACAGAVCVADDEWRTVNTEQGPVRGRRDASLEFYAFYNIPYATAPKGKDRFKAPLPGPTWLQPLDAVNKGIICPQTKTPFFTYENNKTQEDCLVANVFVPNTEEKNLAVLVYIHGGAYVMGYGNWLGFTNLVKSKQVIIVNFNYRLGVHGFLCLGTEGAPGNAGMKDMVALLRWVKTNIPNFGGNPNDVTIAGYSAGSSAVDLIMLSKTAQGLFNKVIPESGANLATFSIQLDPVENAKMYARNLNFTGVDDIYSLEEFYQTVSFDVLLSDAFFDSKDPTVVFSPCMERDIGEEVFLDDSPFNILHKGTYNKVPMLYGFANMEGLIRINAIEMWKNETNKKYSDLLPADLKFENDEQREQVAKQIEEFYFGGDEVQEKDVLAFVDFFTDIMFAYPTLRAVKLHAEAGHDQVYLYEYSFVDEDTPFVPHTTVRGANHCAQTMAVGDGLNLTHSDESISSPELRNMKKIMREIWLNFVTTGKTVPEGSSLPSWPAAGADRAPHMSLGRTVELRGVLLEQRVRFWDDIYSKYYRQPAAPPAHPPPKKKSE